MRRFLLDDTIVERGWTENEIRASMSLYDHAHHGMFAVRLNGERALIGICGYRYFNEPPDLQLLYAISPDHWSKGIASEAAAAMIRYGFDELGLERIVASADAPNTASIRVMQKCGMTYEKTVVIDERDTVYYVIER